MPFRFYLARRELRVSQLHKIISKPDLNMVNYGIEYGVFKIKVIKDGKKKVEIKIPISMHEFSIFIRKNEDVKKVAHKYVAIMSQHKGDLISVYRIP